MWRLIVFPAIVAAINFPEVQVNKGLLTKYGVVDDVNRPNYFETAFSNFQATLQRTDDVTLQLQKAFIQETYKDVHKFPPVKLAQSLLGVSTMVNCAELVQFSIAHLLNVWDLYHKSASDLNFHAYQTFKRIKGTDEATMRRICTSNRLLLTEAHKGTDSFDPEERCADLAKKLFKDESIIDNYMHKSEMAEKALHKLQSMVESGESYSLEEMSTFVAANPIFDSSLMNQFESLLADNLKGYSEAVKELIETPSTAPFMEAIARELSRFGDAQQRN